MCVCVYIYVCLCICMSQKIVNSRTYLGHSPKELGRLFRSHLCHFSFTYVVHLGQAPLLVRSMSRRRSTHTQTNSDRSC